jgi:glycosyltransferase involved in cell wall biosynthesis
MAPYALSARKRTVDGRQRLVVLDQHNAVFQIPRRLAQHETNPFKRALLALEGRKLARYELQAFRQFDHVVWVSQVDRTALRAQMTHAPRPTSDGGPRSSVIPICVDPDEQPLMQRRRDAHRVTFLGGLHWPPNAEGIVWFAQEVWPRVRQQIPGAVLTVIGKDPPRALAAAGNRRMGVEITGYVRDPTPFLAESAVFIVPLHAGGGMRVKILDAWCWGLPVISTHVGAEGIRVRDRENALLADTPDGFAQAVVRALREPELAARLALAGRRTVEAHYDWHTAYRAWERVYRRARTQDTGPSGYVSRLEALSAS